MEFREDVMAKVMKIPVELDNKKCPEELCKRQVIKDELDIDVKRRDVSGPAPDICIEEIYH